MRSNFRGLRALRAFSLLHASTAQHRLGSNQDPAPISIQPRSVSSPDQYPGISCTAPHHHSTSTGQHRAPQHRAAPIQRRSVASAGQPLRISCMTCTWRTPQHSTPHHSTTAPQHHSTAQHSTTAPQHHSTTAPQQQGVDNEQLRGAQVGGQTKKTKRKKVLITPTPLLSRIVYNNYPPLILVVFTTPPPILSNFLSYNRLQLLSLLAHARRLKNLVIYNDLR